MTTEIELVGAVFRCGTEREIFLRRLEEIAGVRKVGTEDDTVVLTVADDQEDHAVVDVKAICDFWNSSYRLRSVES